MKTLDDVITYLERTLTWGEVWAMLRGKDPTADLVAAVESAKKQLKKRIVGSDKLQPATKFLGLNWKEQFSHVQSEYREEISASNVFAAVIDAESRGLPVDMQQYTQAKRELAMEIIDGQISRETLLHCLGYTQKEINELKKAVVEKNFARGYYDANE